MSDVGMRMNVSAEGAMPFRKFLKNEIKLGERSDLQRYLRGSAEERARILSDATAQEFYRQLENERIYKVGDNQFIIMRRGERSGAVIGTEEDASQHASNW
jgi:aromatic ring hydroxylase